MKVSEMTCKHDYELIRIICPKPNVEIEYYICRKCAFPRLLPYHKGVARLMYENWARYLKPSN